MLTDFGHVDLVTIEIDKLANLSPEGGLAPAFASLRILDDKLYFRHFIHRATHAFANLKATCKYRTGLRNLGEKLDVVWGLAPRAFR